MCTHLHAELCVICPGMVNALICVARIVHLGLLVLSIVGRQLLQAAECLVTAVM